MNRSLRKFALSAAAALACLAPAFAEPIPEPKEPLKDFRGHGFIQIDLPPETDSQKNVLSSGFRTVIPIEQAYVRPDRIFVGYTVSGFRQAVLVQANVERSWSPEFGYIVERSYRNLDKAVETPMAGARISMVTLARTLREVTTGRLLPDEDLDALKARNERRIAELQEKRVKLEVANNPQNLPEYNELSSEMARLRDDVIQMEIRRAHPCHIVEFQNKDIAQTLLTRGLMGDLGAQLISRGKTTVWITRAEGLPIKLETTGNDGRVAIAFCFTNLKINQGLRPSEVVLPPSPPGTPMVQVVADVTQRDWEEKMDESIKKQVELLEQIRRKQMEQAQGAPVQLEYVNPALQGKKKR